MLKYVSKLSTRSIYVTGVGSTSAGLTVAAVKVQCTRMLNKTKNK